MPTEPNGKLLNPELSVATNKEFIAVASPLLRELVNFGTHAFIRCSTSAMGEKNEDLAALALYLHMVEITDGIEVLISQCAATPAVPLVRSSFEALLSLEYILKENYTIRSLSWLVEYVHGRLSFYYSLNPETDKGKDFLRIKAADEIARNLVFPVEDAKSAAANLEPFLSSAQIRPIEDEYSKLKKGHRGTVNWFQLFGGPTSIRALAIHLNRGAQYEILYRNWSHICHANDISRYLGKTKDGERLGFLIRNPFLLKEVCSFSSSFLLTATMLIIGKFRPDEDLKSWYLREIQERLRLVTKR